MNYVEKIKVMVVDDHPLMRVGIAAIINAQGSDMGVSCSGRNRRRGRRVVPAGINPDITLMDLRLPGNLGAWEAIEAIRTKAPRARSYRVDHLRR